MLPEALPRHNRSQPLDPQASAAEAGPIGATERARDEPGKAAKCVVAAEHHAEARRKHEQRAEDVLLVPAPIFAQDPIARVVGREEDVVNVDANAARETWKDFEVKKVHVATGLRNVGRIDE